MRFGVTSIESAQLRTTVSRGWRAMARAVAASSRHYWTSVKWPGSNFVTSAHSRLAARSGLPENGGTFLLFMSYDAASATPPRPRASCTHGICPSALRHMPWDHIGTGTVPIGGMNYPCGRSIPDLRQSYAAWGMMRAKRLSQNGLYISQYPLGRWVWSGNPWQNSPHLLG